MTGDFFLFAVFFTGVVSGWLGGAGGCLDGRSRR
jgi:hypothetical protein